MTKITLWPHQERCLSAIEAEWQRGVRRTLCVLATGSGKTMIFLHLLDHLTRDRNRALIIAHRRELIYQPLQRAMQFYPDLAQRMGVVMAQDDDADAQVVIATVQTLNANGRLDRLLESSEFDYVVLDEAHHGTASSYVNLANRLGDARWLGMTATPLRTDKDGLIKVFQSVAFRYPIQAAVREGILCPFDAYAIGLPVSLANVRETHEGWDPDELGDVLSAGNVMEIIYDKWSEMASDRKTMAFTTNVRQAYALADYFAERGVAAEAADGTTPKAMRDDLLERFHAGEIQVAICCQLWTEGVDVPDADCAIMAAPCKSDLAYIQKMGRVLRTAEGKRNALILDFFPIAERNIFMAGDILGKPLKVKTAEEKAARAGVILEGWGIDELGLEMRIDPQEVVVAALNYMRRNHLAWALVGNIATAVLSEQAMLCVVLPELKRLAKAEQVKAEGIWDESMTMRYEWVSGYRLYLVHKDAFGYTWSADLVGRYPDFEAAATSANILASQHEDARLSMRRKRWRHQSASFKQTAYMQRLGIEVPDDCTKGQASQLIAQALASRTVLQALPGDEERYVKGARC